MPQEYSFPSQAADYKSATQLKTRPHTDILQKPHLDLELYLYVLEIHEHLFSKNWLLMAASLKRRKTKTNKKQKKKKKNNNNDKKKKITKKK